MSLSGNRHNMHQDVTVKYNPFITFPMFQIFKKPIIKFGVTSLEHRDTFITLYFHCTLFK